ncbi:MAG: hypothetical protein H6782_01795 [Candidatus Nomurabacteria bacterium]|nr:MAG: hypothetical protein H6782_01795 [Candidatus Nomurabacteria bacterium]
MKLERASDKRYFINSWSWVASWYFLTAVVAISRLFMPDAPGFLDEIWFVALFPGAIFIVVSLTLIYRIGMRLVIDQEIWTLTKQSQTPEKLIASWLQLLKKEAEGLQELFKQQDIVNQLSRELSPDDSSDPDGLRAKKVVFDRIVAEGKQNWWQLYHEVQRYCDLVTEGKPKVAIPAHIRDCAIMDVNVFLSRLDWPSTDTEDEAVVYEPTEVVVKT